MNSTKTAVRILIMELAQQFFVCGLRQPTQPNETKYFELPSVTTCIGNIISFKPKEGIEIIRLSQREM
jgi:hypothetical protein